MLTTVAEECKKILLDLMKPKETKLQVLPVTTHKLKCKQFMELKIQARKIKIRFNG